MENKIENNLLLVHNVPNSVEFVELLRIIFPNLVTTKPFGRRRLLIQFASAEDAALSMETFQNQEFFGKKLKTTIFVENSKNHKSKHVKHCNKKVQTSLYNEGETAVPEISKYLRKLYACESNLGFEQPPPPYLKYVYPPINSDILDAISIALMSNIRFYTQVLHLMNRMNLEPPFGTKRKEYFQHVQQKNVETQTDMLAEVFEKKSTSESELESSDENLANEPKVLKRKLPFKSEHYKKKARQLLKQTLQEQQAAELSSSAQNPAKDQVLQRMFEQSDNLKVGKINMALPHKMEVKTAETSKNVVVPCNLDVKQLDFAQLQEMKIFQNYQEGEPSSKLYIKNLNKDVIESDLLSIYSHYADSKNLEIKVLQQGRMKGQAFVTFSNVNPDIIAKALKETNGLLLKLKPIVVCYGKK